MKILLVVLAAIVCQTFAAEEAATAEEKTREKRSDRGYGPQPSHSRQQSHRHGYVETHRVVEKKYYKPKQCYQCAYSPPKTYYDKKVYVEEGRYKKQYGQDEYQRHGSNDRHNGYGESRGYDNTKRHGQYGGYTKKTVVPVPYTVYGGWDKCIGPFSKYEAKHFGVDEWDCHSNCYTRRDPNGDVFRGCHKGEYNVDPYRLGCHKQSGSIWCFCEGDKCNNGPSPGGYPSH